MIRIDLEAGKVSFDQNERTCEVSLATPEAFRLISEVWLRCGWDNKYVYGFSWMGRPIIQLPDDLIRLQELIYGVQPDVIIETGVAHGGGLVFYASLCKAMSRGRVVGIDIEIRPHNRQAIEQHALSSFITLIEGSSAHPEIVARAQALIRPGDKVIVFLDSCHTKKHVFEELEAYGPLVTKGSYMVAMDGIMGKVVGAPRTQPDWGWNNPSEAAKEFVGKHPEFVLAEPTFPFNEGAITERVTYWPAGILKRIA